MIIDILGSVVIEAAAYHIMFRKEKKEIKKELKQEKKELRKDIINSVLGKESK